MRDTPIVWGNLLVIPKRTVPCTPPLCRRGGWGVRLFEVTAPPPYPSPKGRGVKCEIPLVGLEKLKALPKLISQA